MPQLDTFSYFSTVVYLILLFLTLVFIMHTYYLPKISAALKIRAKLSEFVTPESTLKSKLREDSKTLIPLMSTFSTTLPKQK
jgi:hypothetical protein